MSRILPSPNAVYTGSVTLAEPLTFPQLAAFAESLEAAGDVLEAARAEAGPEAKTYTYDQIAYNVLLVPGVMACVEKWELDGGFPAAVTKENFPATPLEASRELIAWLVREIRKIVNGERRLPNA